MGEELWRGASVVAVGAVSALGSGADAYRGPAPGERPRSAVKRDPELAAAGLARPVAARTALPPQGEQDPFRAHRLLESALAECLAGLDRASPAWRGRRVGVAVGTSSGGMRAMEAWLAGRGAADPEVRKALAAGATYLAPLERALAVHGLEDARRASLLGACASSVLALGVALRWLERGACDVVLAGGYDALSVFVAAGFEGLRATSATGPDPFAVGRDGLSLGEGAAVVALVRGDEVTGAVLGRVVGFGASTDAVHITAPDRTGGGLARAAFAALHDAGLAGAAVDLISAHGTATPFNDAMEARAIHAIARDVAPEVSAASVPAQRAPLVHAFKADIGHTLGAAGVLEALAAMDALTRGVAPPTSSRGSRDPDAAVTLLERAEARPLAMALKLSAAFGGANAALVLTRDPIERARRPSRRVVVRAWVRAVPDDATLDALERATGAPRDRLARLDSLCRIGLASVAALAARVGRERLDGAGIVVGQAMATIDTNARFADRLRTRGATAVEARLFPATSPNAIAGECAIPFHLTGPSFAVGGGPYAALEALSAGAELVAAGDVERVVVLAADDAGPVARELLRDAGSLRASSALTHGGVAALLESVDERGAGAGLVALLDLNAVEALAARARHEGARDPEAVGHLALLEAFASLAVA